jgi:S-adenosylmethionine synthetase
MATAERRASCSASARSSSSKRRWEIVVRIGMGHGDAAGDTVISEEIDHTVVRIRCAPHRHRPASAQ